MWVPQRGAHGVCIDGVHRWACPYIYKRDVERWFSGSFQLEANLVTFYTVLNFAINNFCLLLIHFLLCSYSTFNYLIYSEFCINNLIIEFIDMGISPNPMVGMATAPTSWYRIGDVNRFWQCIAFWFIFSWVLLL